jgi:hypothetical protein
MGVQVRRRRARVGVRTRAHCHGEEERRYDDTTTCSNDGRGGEERTTARDSERWCVASGGDGEWMRAGEGKDKVMTGPLEGRRRV